MINASASIRVTKYSLMQSQIVLQRHDVLNLRARADHDSSFRPLDVAHDLVGNFLLCTKRQELTHIDSAALYQMGIPLMDFGRIHTGKRFEGMQEIDPRFHEIVEDAPQVPVGVKQHLAPTPMRSFAQTREPWNEESSKKPGREKQAGFLSHVTRFVNDHNPFRQITMFDGLYDLFEPVFDLAIEDVRTIRQIISKRFESHFREDFVKTKGTGETEIPHDIAVHHGCMCLVSMAF